MSLPVAKQNAEVKELAESRPDMLAEYQREVSQMKLLSRVLNAGPYPGMGEGNPDLYKAFTWRFWQLVRDGGRIGVVLPRSALSASGSAEWRETVIDGGQFADVTTMTNRGGWVFDDAEHRYTIGLISIEKDGKAERTVNLIGPFNSLEAYRAAMDQPRVSFPADAFKGWSSGAAFPLLPTVESGEVFLKLRRHPRFDDTSMWWVRAVQGDFNATSDKGHMVLAPESTSGLWAIFKGSTFDLWNPDTGDYYAWAKPEHVCRVLQEKRLRQARRAAPVLAHLSAEVLKTPATLPCRQSRIAFRDVARATDSRTVHAALVPPDVILANQAPYLAWVKGDERDQAFLLGVLCSIPLDWYARRFVEIHLNFHVLYPFPVPRPKRDDPLRRRAEELSGRLAAVDDRYDEWATAVGVPVGSVTDPAQKADMIAELDAAVSLLYDLEEADVRHIFETFHVGWDYHSRLDAVLAHYWKLKGAT